MIITIFCYFLQGDAAMEQRSVNLDVGIYRLPKLSVNTINISFNSDQ